jgi:catechol 2,3-dioxygenase-like lactoylglutathione lyase family enzyme
MWNEAMITALNHITLAVTEIERSFSFYRDVLGFRPLVKWNKGAYFLIGPEENGFWFCLNVDRNRQPTSCYTHYAFSVSESDFEKLSRKIIENTVLFKENTSPGDSLYFLDPDGHKLEIHTGNWKTRLDAKLTDVGSWENVKWFV